MDDSTTSLRRTPVRVESVRCLRVRHRASTCTACRDACPRNAVSYGPGPIISPERCDGCGACAGVCPPEALDIRGVALPSVLVTAEGRTPVYVCRHAAGGQGAQVPCLAFLDVGALVATARHAASVTLEAGPCPGCPDARNLALAERAVAAANAVLSLYGGEPRLSFRRTHKYTAGESVSRRGLFTLVRRRAQAQLESDPEPPNNPVARGSAMRGAVRPYRRTLLVYAAQALAGENRPLPVGGVEGSALPFFGVRLDEKCDGCGMCLTFCPTHALRAERTDDGVTYAFTADYCLGCNLCVEVCPRGAVSLARTAGRPPLGESLPLRLEAVHQCAHCGVEFPGAEGARLCPQCAQRQALQDAVRQSLFPKATGDATAECAETAENS